MKVGTTRERGKCGKIMMMVAASLGGYVGAPLARALPRAALRALVIAIGALMSAVFFWRLVG